MPIAGWVMSVAPKSQLILKELKGNKATFGRRKWQPTPVFLPGESQGQRSRVGCCLWGRTESDLTEATQQQQHQQSYICQSNETELFGKNFENYEPCLKILVQLCRCGSSRQWFVEFPRFREVGSFFLGSLIPGYPSAHALRNADLGIKWKAYWLHYCILWKLLSHFFLVEQCLLFVLLLLKTTDFFFNLGYWISSWLDDG